MEGSYDLEERTFEFARRVCQSCKDVRSSQTTSEYVRQVVRSSASVGANYIEANEALGSRDFVMKLKICRREAKESLYWLRLLQSTEAGLQDASQLICEASELKKIFSAIINKVQHH